MAIQVRSLDYYLKDMPYDAKKDVLLGIGNINGVVIKQLLEKEQNYPSFRSMGFSNNDIMQVLAMSAQSFKNVNKLMMDNGRYPLFQNPDDTFAASQEYMNLLRVKTDEELTQEFGCTIEEYKPRTYKKKAEVGDMQI